MIERFKQFLKDNGQSLTGPRLAVFGYLSENDPTTVAAVVAKTPRVDPASVYRALRLFRDLGIVQDIVTGGRRMIELTDSFDRHHHHLSCTGCGAITAVDDPELEQRLNQLAAQSEFEPVSHHIEVTGLCRNCR